MTNECICCSLREDLLVEVGRLAREGRFDYLAVLIALLLPAVQAGRETPSGGMGSRDRGPEGVRSRFCAPLILAISRTIASKMDSRLFQAKGAAIWARAGAAWIKRKDRP